MIINIYKISFIIFMGGIFLYNYYVVQKGDTLYNIANKFNTNVSEISRLNNLNNNSILQIGDVLTVPITDTNNNFNTNSNINNLLERYTIKNGDNIYNISERFNVPIDILMFLNALTSSYLAIGQSIIVPKKTSSFIITKEGDTLENLVKENNIDLNKLIESNRLYLVPNQLILYEKNNM